MKNKKKCRFSALFAQAKMTKNETRMLLDSNHRILFTQRTHFVLYKVTFSPAALISLMFCGERKSELYNDKWDPLWVRLKPLLRENRMFNFFMVRWQSGM